MCASQMFLINFCVHRRSNLGSNMSGGMLQGRGMLILNNIDFTARCVSSSAGSWDLLLILIMLYQPFGS